MREPILNNPAMDFILEQENKIPLYKIYTVEDTTFTQYKPLKGKMLLMVNDYKTSIGNVFPTQAILEDGRIPMSVADIMVKRLQERKDPIKNNTKHLNLSDINDWKEYDFCTGDAIVRNYDGRHKIVLDAYNKDIIPKINNKKDSLEINHRIGFKFAYPDFDKIEGIELKKEDFYLFPTKKNSPLKNTLSFHLKNNLIRKVLKNRVWNILARDKGLLEEYAENIFYLDSKNSVILGDIKDMNTTELWNDYKNNEGIQTLSWIRISKNPAPKIRVHENSVLGFCDNTSWDCYGRDIFVGRHPSANIRHNRDGIEREIDLTRKDIENAFLDISGHEENLAELKKFIESQNEKILLEVK
ncbi:MAG: hypothetical protein ACP5OG_02935 [Candidatus Nanoarchaeia archaeon]